MTTLEKIEKIRAEIQKVLDKERDFTSESAKAQALALMWVLELFDKYAYQKTDINYIGEFCHKHGLVLMSKEMADKYAEQEPCEDAVSRQAVLEAVDFYDGFNQQHFTVENLREDIEQLPSVRPQEQTGHCKDCKYFEYDSVANVDGIPLIVAHEICNKWGDGCKTKEDGYCFLYEPQESEGKE